MNCIIIIPDFPEVQVEEVEVGEEITLTLRTTSPTAACPSCGTASSRIQSRYTRTLRDLPSVGRPIRLILHVRRFFCKKSNCAQKIFVERLPELCHPHAQRIKRLQKALCELGLKEPTGCATRFTPSIIELKNIFRGSPAFARQRHS